MPFLSNQRNPAGMAVPNRGASAVDGNSQAADPYRILYVENGIGYGGAIICLRHLVCGLDRTRFAPLVVTGRTGDNYREIAAEAHWQHIRDRYIDIVSMRSWVDGQRWLRFIPGLRSILNQVIARLDDLGNFLPFFLRLGLFAWRYQPDLIHANNEPLSNRATLLVGKILGKPVISHIRADVREIEFGRRLYRLPDYFICVSQWVSQGLSRLGIPDSKKAVVYDGIPLEKLDLATDGAPFRAAYDIPAEAFCVGLVGLLIPWKGQNLFIEAARSLRAQIPHLRMMIVGGTPDDCRAYERSLHALVIQYGLEQNIIFTGHVNDMPMVYNGLDIVVSASVTPEPLGTMVIEAMTMARPLIVPNHGGGAEMVEHENTGLQFEAGSAASLAAAISRLHQHPDFAASIAREARQKALATFAVAEHVRQVQTLYNQFL